MNKSASLPPAILNVIRDKGTEPPYSGEYNDLEQAGTYLCRQCGLALFRSQSKFHSGCGWPSFDNEVNGHVLRQVDHDGYRTEILCTRCHGHLGHVFMGEGFTAANMRHCVNSLSMDFVTDLSILDTEEAIFAAGCFWGVEYYFNQLPGVLKVESGYSGGHVDSPTYEEICTGTTGHYECVRVIYDPAILSYEALVRYFFEIHDFTQTDGQGPDLGAQYLTVIFTYTNDQRHIAESVIDILKSKGYQVATRLMPVHPFWRAETYHQQYYQKTGKHPYCHRYQKRFD